ncbi:hypothetical protein [Paraburkholderia sp. Cpub6]|nr:hypothetical protein [Paraburkholderia sp. Cpub6]MBB5461360.1 hypothetical protein [Paraburkholderia sp. Cpub6]
MPVVDASELPDFLGGNAERQSSAFFDGVGTRQDCRANSPGVNSPGAT